MAYDQEVGTGNLRGIFYDSAVKQIAAQEYKFKQAVSIVSTSAWTNYFYRESTTELTNPSGNNIKGIPRGAAFPQAVVSWERVSAVMQKFGLEDNITWEDILSNNIDVRDRTLIRIARRVAKAVDDEIWDALTESRTVVNIQTLATGNRGWNQSSAQIIDDLMQAKQKISEYNYDTSNLMVFVSPRDHRSIVKYLTDKGAQFPSISTTAATNGNAGNLAGITIVVSNSVTASYALVVVPKVVGTWKEMVPLSTTTVEDPYKSVKIRSVEMGVTELTDPKAAVLITSTELA